MKRRISIIAFCWFMSLQYVVFAASPCSTGFALGYAIAARDFAQGVAYCREALLEGPCKDEITRSYNHTIATLFTNFNACCCANGYIECCN